jgi:hypothetical protein
VEVAVEVAVGVTVGVGVGQNGCPFPSSIGHPPVVPKKSTRTSCESAC